ncbi:Rieske 2Fe-2S domain-containing protein [Mycobacterium hodleri]|uniref:Rieske (2Fe-2S) protein n=1 Tax=Mycolicibacterium hodleri TaxID=49897 RepID=UPI0021F273C4|nr:Rieske 2Fe-2S domain-containing protein [Mycolicibacterium hodleri]MCV7131625.1 Rieske 2Fe-2S domain-containing protein [Mycolicibacterium hodleri]
MNAKGLNRYVDDLLRGRRPKGFTPDDFEAAQMRTAIELTATREHADEPSPGFLDDLHARLAEQMDDEPAATQAPPTWLAANRRQVIVGTSAAATAAVAVDRLLGAGDGDDVDVAQDLVPTKGAWQRVASSAEVPEGAMRPFDLGSIVGFVRRVDGRPEGISGICTHQGCKLWFDAPDDRLRCPCHSTSFSKDGQVLAHQLPISPKPLPALNVREVNGNIEVFAPPSGNQQT